MSFFKKLVKSAVKSPKDHFKSAVNVARNPTDLKAHEQYLKASFADAFMPGLTGFGGKKSGAQQGEQELPQDYFAQYAPQMYQAPQQYQSFSQLFNQPQFDYSQVDDVYQRGAMPNNLLNRYNSLMQNLQSQQAAMVPRQQAQPTQTPRPFNPGTPQPYGIPGRTGGYVNFSQLFGGGR